MNAADIRHIAEMKAAQHSYFRWAIGLGAAYLGVTFTDTNAPRDLLNAAGAGVMVIAIYTAIYIVLCHLSMVGKRKRLWKVYRDLHLADYIDKKEEAHTDFWYGGWTWVPMVLISAGIAIVSGFVLFCRLCSQS